MNTIYRIHGDNIMECEVATSVILDSISFASGNNYVTELVSSTSFTPAVCVKFEDGLTFILEFFPGHNRWNVSLPDYLAQRGALLRESVDAFVTLVQKDTEAPVAAFEFCNALPAGNNAWQRAGRALAITGAGIPYFYFAEIGGQELDADRNIKAPRFPNPIVTFSYLSNSSAAPDKCTTVYMASRSISKGTYEEFKEVLANNEYKRAIAALFTGEDVSDESFDSSKQKSAKFVYDLAQRRKRNNTHSLQTWQKMLDSASSGTAVASHLINDALAWNKKISIPANASLSKLVDLLKEKQASAIGSKDMPFCVLPKKARYAVAQDLKKIYGDTVSQEFLEWLSAEQKDLVFIFIAGFKPRGDDSRPDRGLVPMAKMVFANDDIDLLTVVYGPAKQNTWDRLFSNPTQLAKTNGLWEAIVGLSNAILVDSISLNLADENHRDVILSAPDTVVNDMPLQKFTNLPRFGEHDVDTVLHMIFSDSEKLGVFEALCNPPGGDWSGVSFLDNENATNRWTSLPRVTGLDGKRPDHIIQFFADKKIIMSVESKDLLRNLEENVGPRLDHYTKQLLQTGEAQSRQLKETLEWTQEVDVSFLKKAISEYEYMSAVAVMGDEQAAVSSLEKSNAGAAFAINFGSDETTTLHFVANNPILNDLILKFLATQSDKLTRLKIVLNVLT